MKCLEFLSHFYSFHVNLPRKNPCIFGSVGASSIRKRSYVSGRVFEPSEKVLYSGVSVQ